MCDKNVYLQNQLMLSISTMSSRLLKSSEQSFENWATIRYIAQAFHGFLVFYRHLTPYIFVCVEISKLFLS